MCNLFQEKKQLELVQVQVAVKNSSIVQITELNLDILVINLYTKFYCSMFNL